ncbi:MAG: hypothetical protein RMZ69_23745 [Nostoc sp. ChiQUE01a]|nr:hypothetical protein [Nostoc sp. ChiQUE01a]
MYSGKFFLPKQAQDKFVGLIFVSSLQQKRLEGLKSFYNRVTKQISEAAKQEISWEFFLASFGRVYNGHTALMAGDNRKINKIVGWDPVSAVEALVNSWIKGYSGMEPIQGFWRDDTGMDGDPTAVYYGIPVDQEKYDQFLKFITALENRKDFGEPLKESGIQFNYAFAPATWMVKTSSLENQKLAKDKINIVSNCGDAAFHVLATFLYEWKEPKLVMELCEFANKENNFSQGKLMQWATPETLMQWVTREKLMQWVTPPNRDFSLLRKKDLDE